MRWRLFLTMLLIVVTSLAAPLACGGGDDDDDDSDGDGLGDDDTGGSPEDLEAFLSALPSAESLTVAVPESEAKALGELAEYYEATVDMTREVNNQILAYLSFIDEITSYPPTDSNSNSYVWGPWKDDGLSAVESFFVMSRVGEDIYDYALSWRPKDTDDEWTPVWFGRVEETSETARRGIGYFTLDVDAIARLDPTQDPAGLISVGYDTMTDGREIQVSYTEFQPDDDPEWPGDDFFLNATYVYHNHADNTGVFGFDWMADVHRDDPELSMYDKLEDITVVTRWLADGTGRADVLVTGGDLPDIVYPDYEPLKQYNALECWGSDFLRDFYQEILVDDADAVIYGEPEGNSEDCVTFDE
ncbi:MAG: hypothetical protein H6684_13430 [Deltaproteobacteria bacterium]|nr:hypothetical protein [Deltaproteobacteria bacterium]